MINNTKPKIYILILYILLALTCISFLTAVLLSNIHVWDNYPIHYFLIGSTILCFLALLIKGTFSFKYNAEGGILCFENKDNLTLFGNKISEFPKEKLLDYTIKNHYFFKELILIVKSKKSKSKKIKIHYNISYLNYKELEVLHQTLN